MKKLDSKKVLFLNLLIVLFVLLASSGLYASLNSQEEAKNTYQELIQQEDTLLNHNGSDNGLECFQCHISIASNEPQKKVATDQCLACHSQNYEGLATLTQNLEPNPHKSPHHEDMDCTMCHQVHQESKLMCAECHTFDWMEDLGPSWLK